MLLREGSNGPAGVGYLDELLGGRSASRRQTFSIILRGGQIFGIFQTEQHKDAPDFGEGGTEEANRVFFKGLTGDDGRLGIVKFLGY